MVYTWYLPEGETISISDRMEQDCKRQDLINMAAGYPHSRRSWIIDYGFIIQLVGSEVSSEDYAEMEREAEQARAEVAALERTIPNFNNWSRLNTTQEYARLYAKYIERDKTKSK